MSVYETKEGMESGQEMDGIYSDFDTHNNLSGL